MIAGFAEFEFDLPGALLTNLVSNLDLIAPAPLDAANTAAVPDEQGVYQLLLDGHPVYVGKTDAQAGLCKRLTRHSRKIQHRQNLDPSRVTFKAVRIYVFTAMDMETDLIRHYGGGRGLAWNGSGFGSNDPGRERDTTKNKDTNFDYQYPVDIDRPFITALPAGTVTDTLRALRPLLPYGFRIAVQARHPDLQKASFPGAPGPLTTRQALNAIIKLLPPGWQITVLLGYLIMYKESKNYPDEQLVLRS